MSRRCLERLSGHGTYLREWASIKLGRLALDERRRAGFGARSLQGTTVSVVSICTRTKLQRVTVGGNEVNFFMTVSHSFFSLPVSALKEWTCRSGAPPAEMKVSKHAWDRIAKKKPYQEAQLP